MPTPKTSAKSNTERGLERHVNPNDPTAPMLDHIPDLADRLAHVDHGTEYRKQIKSAKKGVRRRKPRNPPDTKSRRKKV